MPECKRQYGVAILGLGTVGGAVADLLNQSAPAISLRSGCDLRPVSALVRDLNKPRGKLPPGMRLTTDIHEILADPGVHLVVETMGGTDPARRYVLQALGTGRPVVLANKELLSTAGGELFGAAAGAGVDLLFEACVCSGLPVLRALRGGLAGDRVTSLAGVLNGTTNYVLTRMEAGASLGQAVADAQAAGYAEADPANDLEGRDAAWKLAILASLAFDRRVAPGLVAASGLDGLTAHDIRAGLAMGLRLKQLAVARVLGDGSVEARVEPAFVPRESAIGRVDGADNAVVLSAVAAGQIVLSGPGAGGPSAAAAVVADLIEASRNLARGVRDRGCGCQGEAVPAASRHPSRFWLRLAAGDLPRLRLGGVRIERTSRRAYPTSSSLANGQETIAAVTGLMQVDRLKDALRSLDAAAAHPHPIPIYDGWAAPVAGAQR